jgi:hypothetical protein
MATATWLTPEAVEMPGYGVMASPTLYPGQVLTARVEADAQNASAVTCALYIRHYGAEDTLDRVMGPSICLLPGNDHIFTWTIPQVDGYPIAEAGIEVKSKQRACGTLYLDYMSWEGTPEVVLSNTPGGHLWRYAWVNGMDIFNQYGGESFRMIHNEGTGLLIHGTRQWKNYRVCADITPHLAEKVGIAARVQGMRRYYALQLARVGKLQLVRAFQNKIKILAECDFDWDFDETYLLSLDVKGNTLQGYADGKLQLSVHDDALTCGGIALLLAEGRSETQQVQVGENEISVEADSQK